MVLHIAVDGAESEFKTTLIQELNNYLTTHEKKYKVAYIELPQNEEILNLLGNYNLMNHEIALLMATDYSMQYYNTDFREYDFVIWQRTKITNYVYNTDKTTSQTFITVYLFDNGHFWECEVVSHCGFNLHFPNG